MRASSVDDNLFGQSLFTIMEQKSADLKKKKKKIEKVFFYSFH